MKNIKGQKITISVIGGHSTSKKVEQLAHKVGILVAKVGAVLVCGGLTGVMMEASRGAKEGGGLTIGLLPGKDKKDANPFIDIALPTSIGFARNAMVACSADIVIALPGSNGTMSEIGYALVYKRPVIDIGNWKIRGMIPADSLLDVEKKVRKLIAKLNK